MHIEQTNVAVDRKAWLRHLGITGFAFFLGKGLLWLLVPTLFALFR
jgi:hypothetical protein